MPTYAIVGASRGIGLEMVRQLASDDSNTVFAIVRNMAAAVHLAPIAALTNVHVLEADVVDHLALQAAADDIAQKTGGALDVLIHNAARMDNKRLYRGFTDYKDPDELDADFIDAFRVNVLGVVHGISAFVPLLRAGPTRRLFVVSSNGGELTAARRAGAATMVAYSSTRAGSNMVVAKYAALLAREGFVVAALNPGLVDTSDTFMDELGPEGQAACAAVLARNPAYKGVPLTPQQSAARLLQAMASATSQDNGELIDTAPGTVSRSPHT